MTDKNTLNLAREWAEYVREIPSDYSEIAVAAADLISSLPDERVDAKKLREVVADHHIDMSEELMEALGDLLPATPRTLADMSPKERAECQWMQVTDDVGNHVVLTDLNEESGEGKVLYENGGQFSWPYDILVPLPDLPRMVWPETTVKEHGEAPCLLDKDGDHWVKVDGQWHMVDPDFAYDKLPDLHGPYRAFLQEDH